MKIAYTEKANRQYWHVAEIDGFYLAKRGDDVMFRETRVIRRESIIRFEGGQSEVVDVVPPRVEITSEFPVAEWFEVPSHVADGVHRLDDLVAHAAIDEYYRDRNASGQSPLNAHL